MHPRGRGQAARLLVWALTWGVVAGAAVPATALGAEGGPQAATPRGRVRDTLHRETTLEELVRQKARALAARPYQAPPSELPEALKSLSYDQYRDIRFRNEQALWRKAGLRFQAQLFHTGFLYPTPVAVHLVEGGRPQDLPFSPALFDYGRLVQGRGVEQVGGYAGVKLLAPFNRPDHFDEVISFLGASYFRALGQGDVYGLSARGLAIDTALPNGEEFPAFREFWLEVPAARSDRAVVHALLDSPSVAGAYRFVVTPGKRTQVEVHATLHLRKAVQRLGVAPLSSMYLFGENDRGPADDFRPEVHDSDGLFVWTGDGEQLWRPLTNPPVLRVMGFHAQGLRGFGLLQRDTAFTSYEDLEARYDRRPSVWVEPLGDWGPGTVQLVEIPTPQEVHDNVAAFWVPEAPVRPGQELRLSYRLHWGRETPWRQGGAEVVATRVGAGTSPGAQRFVVDFSAGRSVGEGPVEPVVSASAGRISHVSAQRHAVTGGWRVAFELQPAEGHDAPVELRLFLERGNDALSETWSYLWTR